MAEQIQWNSSISFIFAMIGAAVGLGNIWRFSYVLYSNGGGSFFIPYLCAIYILGIPFLLLEYGLGFSLKDSFSNILKSIDRRFEYIAWVLMAFIFIVVSYYAVIISWDLIYLISSFTFSWGADPTIYFSSFVAGSSDLSNAFTLLVPSTLCVIFLWFVLWFISHKDLEEGIGKVSKILIPALFVMMGIIILYAFTLPGHMIGINALIRPNWSTLLDINIWLAAFAQILFSLSMGQAIALTYASYLPEGSKLTDNVLVVVASNCLFEVATAFGVFSILGYMSLHSGIELNELVTEGTGLVFDVFPMIFNIMGSYARILAPLFFLAILFAGITSALGFMEPIVSSLCHKFDLKRTKAATIVACLGCCLSVLLTTGISSYLVSIIDSFINQFGILFLIGVQCVIFAWFYNIDNLIPILNEHGHLRVGKVWKFTIKYLLPILIFFMWICGLFELFMNAAEFEIIVDMIIIVAVLAISIILTRLSPRGENNN